MIYSREDVKRMLAEIRTTIDETDLLMDRGAGILLEKLDEIEGQLSFETTLDDDTCKTCRGRNGKHSSLCGELY